MTSSDINTLRARALEVASSADSFSAALFNQDQDEILNSFDTLMSAYGNYAKPAAEASSRFSFDEVAQLGTPEARDQGASQALMSALVDLEIAGVFSKTAVAMGELDGEVSSDEIDASIASLNELLAAMDSPPGSTRFGFDEVVEAKPVDLGPSADLPAAVKAYQDQVNTVYASLLGESTALLVAMFKEAGELDEAKIQDGLKAVKDVAKIEVKGKAIVVVLDAVSRAVGTIKNLIGQSGLETIDAKVKELVEKIKKGEGVLQDFLKHIYDVDNGKITIETWTKSTQSEIASVDNGTRRLADLNQQVVQTYTVSKKIVSSLMNLSGPVKWMMAKLGGTAPIDLVLLGLYLLIADAALLRGMDYADTTKLVKFVDGTWMISETTLGFKRQVELERGVADG